MLQKVLIIGRLGSEPEMRYSSQGTAITNFSVATDSGWGDKKHTEWFRCVAFQKQAELVAQYLSKGSLCYVEGRLQTRKYEDKAGITRYSTELLVDRVTFLDSKRSRSESEADDDDDFVF